MTIHTTACARLYGMDKHSDAAHHLRDTYSLHRIADPIGNLGHWFWVNLGSGKGDGILYDTRSDAVNHMHHNEAWEVTIQIVPHTMTVCDAESYLIAHRKMREKGIDKPDRDHRGGGITQIPRITTEDQIGSLRALVRGSRPPNLIIPGRN